jgi:RNA polymerase primary sigma factor
MEVATNISRTQAGDSEATDIRVCEAKSRDSAETGGGLAQHGRRRLCKQIRRSNVAKRKENKMTSIPSVGYYLDEITAYSPLSRAEEAELARRIRAGDAQALDKLVEANLKFVVGIAKSYQGRGLPLPDLVSEGNIGLIEAAQRFDETRGYKFISYAVWWVRQAILQALNSHARTVRLPMNRLNAINKISQATDALQKRLWREPSMKELAAALNLSEKQLAEFIQNEPRELSLDQTPGEEDDSSLLNFLPSDEFISADKVLSEESLQHDIDDLLATMDRRTAEIVRRYFGLNGHRPHSLEMLGQQFNLTRERVRQIKHSAIKKLQRDSRARALREYL